jgi:hypothetical protein
VRFARFLQMESKTWQTGAVKRLLGLVVIVGLLATMVVGCDDDDSADSSSSSDYYSEPVADDGCEDLPDHPYRATREARGFVVGCMSDDESSLHVRNVSSHVLKVTRGDGVDSIEPAGVDKDPGVRAALGVTGIGWTTDGSHFVLPIGGSLVASGPGPAVVFIEPDLSLTAQANSARWVGEWIASRLKVRGQALAAKVEGCASSAAQFAQQDAYIEDVLRNALDSYQCTKALGDALLEEGREPQFELPRVRTTIIEIAQPAAEDRLISFAARVFRR